MAATTRNDVLSALSAHREAIRAFGVRKLGLFGSFRRGETRPESDVDFLVEFRPGQKSYDHFINLCFVQEDVLGRRVELVTPESLSPFLAPKILREVEDVPLGE